MPLGVFSLQRDDAVPGTVVDELDHRAHRPHLSDKLDRLGLVHFHKAVVECHEEAAAGTVDRMGLPFGREQSLLFHIVEVR